jgi:cytochrome b561
MNWRNTEGRYGSLSIGLHWGMLLLLAAVYACMELRGNFPKGSGIREGLKTWHFMLGLFVLVLVTVRLTVRFMGTLPGAQADSPCFVWIDDRHAYPRVDHPQRRWQASAVLWFAVAAARW